MSAPKKYLNVKEVAAVYGFNTKTLYKWVGENKVPHYKVNGLIKFSVERLDAWMEKKAVKVKTA